MGAITDATIEEGGEVVANPEFINLVVTTSLLSGAMLAVMGIFRLGFVTSFLSHPVVVGFTSAASLIIGIGQMKHILGYSLSLSQNWFVVVIDMLARFDETHWPSLAMGLITMAVLFVFKNVQSLKKLPAAMLVVLVSVLISWGMDLKEKHGFKVCGEIPMGIPVPRIPDIPSGEKLQSLMPVIIVSALIGYMESIVVGLTYASKNHYSISSNQELLAFGASNIIGSFFNCYPNAGGFGRSAVNANSGAKTQLAGLISGCFILMVLAFLTPLFYHLPKPALGAIVVVAVSGLFDYGEAVKLFKSQAWPDLFALVGTFFSTLVLGPEIGIGIGIACSILSLLAVTSVPAYAVLGNVPGTEDYFNFRVFSEAQEVPGTLIIRFDADLWFANAARFKEAVIRECYQTARDRAVERLILVFQGVNLVDASAIHALHETIDEVRSSGVHTIAIAGARRNVRSRLIQEFNPKSFVRPDTAPSRLLSGVSQPQLLEVFSAHPRHSNGTLPKSDAEILAAKISKSVGNNTYKGGSLVGLVEKEGSDAASAASTAPIELEEAGMVERITFGEFLCEHFPSGGGDADPEGEESNKVTLYPSTHAAVIYAGRPGELAPDEAPDPVVLEEEAAAAEAAAGGGPSELGYSPSGSMPLGVP